MRSRRAMPEISRDLRDRYYFIDYLRLHRYGKDNEIWKKNRNMLVREHEYSASSETRARKGYKSYIQRCMKSILDTLYPDFTIIKPRNVFGYEIGQKNDSNKDLLDMGLAEDKIKLVLARYISAEDNADAVVAYRDAVLGAGRVSFKNKEAGLAIKLDDERSLGYQAVKELIQIRETQNALLEIGGDVNGLLKSLVIEGIEKAYKAPNGTRVQRLENGRPSNTFGTIESVRDSSSYRGKYYSYNIQWDNQQGQGTTAVYSDQVKIVYGEATEAAEVSRVESVSPLLDRIINYANENFGGTAGVDRGTIFSLARGAVVREILNDGDVHTAGIVRQMEPLASTLERIDVELSPGQPMDDEDYDDFDIEDDEPVMEVREIAI